MLSLLEDDPHERLTVCKALKHHWFINQKKKKELKPTKTKKLSVLPSLKTILEIREQSSYGMLSSRHNSIEFESEDEVAGDEHDNLHRISKENSPVFEYLLMSNNFISVASKKKQTPD